MKLLREIPKAYLFLGIIIILIVFISLYQVKNSQKTISNYPAGNKNQNVNRQEKEEGDVSVVVEYFPQKLDKNTLVFEITLDTHNVDLNSFDFTKDIFLEKEGISSLPVNAIPSGSGHHRKAEVIFKRVESPFIVSLKNLSGVSTREFKFDRK